MIFGIGLPKTGTTSLTQAMRVLGFNSAHYLSNQQYINLPKFDFVSDLPIPARYKSYDLIFPNSKFIYTTRDIDTWLDSCEYQWRVRRPSKARVVEMFGVEYFSKKVFKEVYIKHDLQIKEYFASRPLDLLILSIQNGWEPLCSFLNKDIPNIEFPHLNKRKPR